ncbi:hypothetical protein ACGFZ3_05680 [Stenotrophomonas sp. NPDC047960]|uniref:hypothetical protein n=1 Tax=Stenotrophomonas sp. NPDC047960 TaxID=3364531 RepID=UPI0037173ECB
MKVFSDDWFRAEWRKLGFHYDRDDETKQWNIVGSKAGLRSLVTELRDYASDQENDWVSCHCNSVPYDYLEFGTWASAVIDNHWIAGPLVDLLGLASHIGEWVDASQIGALLSVRPFFSPGSPYDLCLRVEADDFDPSSLDTALLGAAGG